MRIKAFTISLLLFFSLAPCFAQDITITELQKKILELEKRIEVLEKIIAKTNSGEIINNQVFDKAIWRKLHFGMKEKEVIALLGEPTHIVRSSPDYCSWTYFNGKTAGMIMFDAKGVSSWTEPYF